MCPVAIVTNSWILMLGDSWPNRDLLCLNHSIDIKDEFTGIPCA